MRSRRLPRRILRELGAPMPRVWPTRVPAPEEVSTAAHSFGGGSPDVDVRSFSAFAAEWLPGCGPHMSSWV